MKTPLRLSAICLVMLLAISAKAAVLHLAVTDTITKTEPPLQGFYSKYLNCDGIPIRSAAVVDDKALLIASEKIKRMLRYMTIAHKNLVNSEVELHIIGQDQQTSDLPEFHDQKGVTYMDNGMLTDIDKRTRGMGGNYASCGEENLLQLPNDRYRGGYDICVHEFAHTLMDYGLDTILQGKIKAQQRKAVAGGLWKGAYAGSNPQEYWAELSSWYFGGHGDYLSGNIPTQGVLGLKAYDPEGYALVDSIYRGLLQPGIEKKASILVLKGARSGMSTEKSELTVINNRMDKLKLYWVDHEGNEKFFQEIPSKAKIQQPTFKSHVWMVQDGKGEALLYIKVNDPPCELKINEP